MALSHPPSPLTISRSQDASQLSRPLSRPRLGFVQVGLCHADVKSCCRAFILRNDSGFV